MTIIDELLILLDDLEQAPADAIPHYFDEPNLQVIFSSLGRLVNRGWVSKQVKRSETVYAITIHGVNELNQTLDAIKKEEQQPWDKRWHQVVFDIPETKRKSRDSFRVYVKSLGYGMLTSSVWMSPWNQDESIKRYCKRNSLFDNVFLMATSPIEDTYQSTVFAHRCWNWAKIEKSYKDFLSEGGVELRTLANAGEKSRFLAKKLVFRYAEIVKEDPQLPTDIAPNAMLAKRANDLYAKIRPYCLRQG